MVLCVCVDFVMCGCVCVCVDFVMRGCMCVCVDFEVLGLSRDMCRGQCWFIVADLLNGEKIFSGGKGG